MPIVKKVRSDERTAKGTPVYIIKTPVKNFNGSRFDLTFYKGTAKTTSRLKAKLLSEAYGYKVILPTGVEPWTERKEELIVKPLEEFNEEWSDEYEDEFEDADFDDFEDEDVDDDSFDVEEDEDE